jgi:NTE family protein
MPPLRSRPSLGLALGGGAARGLAHIGVLKVLEREGVQVDLIAGTSIGALVGGVYATTGSALETERRFLEFADSAEFRRRAFDFIREARQERHGFFASTSALIRRGIFYGYSFYRVSFMSAESLAHNINMLLPEVDIADTRVPFAAVAADLVTGEEVILAGGAMRRMVAASCAIPGILPPVMIDGRTFIDGGWVDRVPALPALRMGADLVVGVDISPEVGAELPRRGVEVMVRATAVQASALKRLQSRFLDLSIQPQVSKLHWADFSAIRRAIAAGESAAEAALPELRRMVSPWRLSPWIGQGRARQRARDQFETLEVLRGVETADSQKRA